MAWAQHPTDRKATLPPDWPARRRRVMKRDGYGCRAIEDGVRCAAVATDVDHVDDRNDHRDANLQSLCGWHHDRKTASQGGRARAIKGSERRKPERHPGLLG